MLSRCRELSHLLGQVSVLLDNWLRLGYLDHDLVVFIAVSVSDLLLIIRASPMAIHDVLVLVLSSCQTELQSELMIMAWPSLHHDSVLPIVERSADVDLTTAMPPHEHMLHN